MLIASPIGVPPIGCSVGGSKFGGGDELDQPRHAAAEGDDRHLDALRRQRIGQQLLLVDLQALVELVDPRPLHRRRRIDDQHAGHARLGVLGKFDCSKRIF